MSSQMRLPSGHLSIYTLEGQHSRVRKAQEICECVLHSFRHTLGTRLGEAGADTFTIMRIMGHSTVTVSQKYVHPTPEALERAFERLEALNQRAAASLVKKGRRLLELPKAPVFLTVADDTVKVFC
jgi:integrase